MNDTSDASPRTYEAVVIGTGFGGAVVACRTAQRWPGDVLVLERGKRYPRGSFARTPRQMRANFWNVDGQPKGHDYRHRDERGLVDVRGFKRMDVISAAGLGGGSLIYANVMLEPPDAVFADPRWPSSCDRSAMAPYYDTVRTVLAARPIPAPTTPERRLPRTKMYQDAAAAMGRSSRLLDLAVFFGPDPEDPLPPGVRAPNRYGVEQTSCTYCAECCIGCNEHSKSSLDLNYLFVAEHRHGATVATECLAESIVPVNEAGQADPGADGTHGYRVTYRVLDDEASTTVLARRVIVSAGSLGSTELLLRCRDVHGTLTRLSPMLGERWSGNGDFLAILAGADVHTEPEQGPVITQAIDFNLFDDHDPKRAFVLEDAGYPRELSWFVEASKPKVLKVRALAKTVGHTIRRLPRRRTRGRIGYQFRDALGGTITGRSTVMLCMGIDNGAGRLDLDRNGWVRVHWSVRDNRELYKAIVTSIRGFRDAVRGKVVVSAPGWWLPFRRNVTVHALGGCVLGASPDTGVVDQHPERFGQVFGYRNLHVADGAIVPAAVGSNPALTIAALAERVAEAITGLTPDVDLGTRP